MRGMFRFFWPIVCNFPWCVMKAGHAAHTVVFFASLVIFFVAGFYESKAVMVISLATLILLIGWNFLVSVYEHHCKLLRKQVKTLQTPAIAKTDSIRQELQGALQCSA